MTTELPKSFDPAVLEPIVRAAWESHRAFAADPSDPGEPYSIVIPPPNVTAALHLGHALNNTLQDILIRKHRMRGDNAVWLPGTDHAGIATQTVVEKRVFQEEGKRRTDFARDEFIGRIQAWKDDYEARITEQLKAMGCSCDWDRQAFTMDPPRAAAVREAFFRLFADGLIYRGKRLVNWDPATQTALADDEVEMEEIDGHFYYLRYPLADGSGHVTVATTRPETMLGDTAVAINPRDPRAADLRGQSVRLPIVGREIPIVEDNYVVMPVRFGGDDKDPKAVLATGFLKVTPAHDPNDHEIGRRHNLAVINVLAPDGTISDRHGWTDIGDAGFVLGQTREDARQAIVHWFKVNGLLEEIKPYRHSVGHSYRSHVAIEPYLSDQWYCKVTDPRLAGAALAAMAEDQRDGAKKDAAASSDHSPKSALRFHPARYARTFQTWHENIRDWCISRQLWWGHRIPVWSSPAGRVSPANFADPANVSIRAMDDAQFVCLRTHDDAAVAVLESAGFTQDPDVLDTWFSSALWPMSTLGWPDADAIADPRSALNVWNPTSVLCTAREIITLWVSRMVMFNLYFLNRLPFRDVFIHAMIQDGHGQKMSKSLGNGVDPMDIIHSHGADAMRFTLTGMATNTQDVRLPVDMVDPVSAETFTPHYITDSAGYTVAAPIQQAPSDPRRKMVSSYGVASGKAHATPDQPVARNTSAKFDFGRNLCNKLWNAGRFVMMSLANAPAPAGDPASTTQPARTTHPQSSTAPAPTNAAAPSTHPAPFTAPAPANAPAPTTLADRWILSRLARAVRDADEGLGAYRFDQYAKVCYDFFWRDFCDWYLEAIKPAMRDPASAPASAAVLATTLDQVLRLMHPAIPFITETLWSQLNSVRPIRGLVGIDAPPSELLIHARWPAPSSRWIDDSAETQWQRLQDIVGAIRNLRNEHKVEIKKRVKVAIAAPPDIAADLAVHIALIDLLATCDSSLSSASPSSTAARATAAGVELYVEGLVDESAEKQRLAKRREELTRAIAAMKARLDNPGYIAKAPPRLVEQSRAQLADAESELAKIPDA